MLGKIELRKINLAVDGLQQRRRLHKPIVATRMNRIEAVGHIVRAHDLNNRHIAAASVRSGTWGSDVNTSMPALTHAKVEACHAQSPAPQGQETDWR